MTLLYRYLTFIYKYYFFILLSLIKYLHVLGENGLVILNI